MAAQERDAPQTIPDSDIKKYYTVVSKLNTKRSEWDAYMNPLLQKDLQAVNTVRDDDPDYMVLVHLNSTEVQDLLMQPFIDEVTEVEPTVKCNRSDWLAVDSRLDTRSSVIYDTPVLSQQAGASTVPCRRGEYTRLSTSADFAIRDMVIGSLIEFELVGYSFRSQGTVYCKSLRNVIR